MFSSLQLNNERFRFNDICRVRNFTELFFNNDYTESTKIIINHRLALNIVIKQSNDLEIQIHSGNYFDDYSKNQAIFSVTINKRDFTYRDFVQIATFDHNIIVDSIRKYEFKSDESINQQRPFTLSIPYGNNLLQVLQRSADLRKEIVGIIKEYGLRLIIDRIDESIKFQKELNDGAVVSIPYHQIADTLKRLIFYKAAIASNSDSVLLFEEPEAHMFPPYISKYTSDVMHDENNNQYFLSTHSPFVLNDFLDNLKADELAIYIVDYRNGETIVHRMNEEDMHEAYQFGYDFFMNIDKFISQEEHDKA